MDLWCPVGLYIQFFFLLHGRGSLPCCHPPPLILSLPAQAWPKAPFILLTDIDDFISCNSCIPPAHPFPPLCSLSSVFPPPSSLCILDHFLSFQVSGPVEADDPSPGGAGPPHCLCSVSLSLCSHYAHSPHPVCVGGRGRGAG